MSDTAPDTKPEKRPAPPDLTHHCPDCGLCGKETYWEDDYFVCEDCDAFWPSPSGERGEWVNPDVEQCKAEWLPRYRGAKPARCILDLGHEGLPHRADSLTDFDSANWRRSTLLVTADGERVAAAPVAGDSA